MNKIKNYLFFVLYVLINPRLVLKLLSGLYLPVYVQYLWLKKYNIKTVVDAGAYKGRVSMVLQDMFPTATFYLFEPSPINLKRLSKINWKSKVNIIGQALSNVKGHSLFYEFLSTELSSFLKLDQKYLPFNNKFKKIVVETTTLDNYFSKLKIDRPIFLKIDTQGSELQVLKGAKEFLKKVGIIHIENSFLSIYKNQSLFDEINSFLVKEGFKYCGSVNDSDFYPQFGINRQENSIFIRK